MERLRELRGMREHMRKKGGTLFATLAVASAVCFSGVAVQAEETGAEVQTEAVQTVEQEAQSEQGEIRMISPVNYSQNGVDYCYTGPCLYEIVFNGKSVSLTKSMPAIQLHDIMMVPLKESIENEQVAGTVVASGSGMTVKRGSYTIYYEEGKSQITVNGENIGIEAAPERLTYHGNEYFMVPAETLFSYLGAETVEINEEKQKLTVKKTKGTFLLYEPSLEIEGNNSLKKVSVVNRGNKELVAITCDKTPAVSVSSTKTKVIITMKNVTSGEPFVQSVLDSTYAKKVKVEKSGTNTKVTVTKKSGVDFICQYGSGHVYLFLNATPIRIAVDCGHGSYTPGKRTPKLPWGLDFDGDGINELRRGQTMKEHQANVGVGKSLASELERLGFKVYRSAFGSADISLSGRQRNIKNFGAKYSISVHFNAAGSGSRFNAANGVEVYYHSTYGKYSKAFAQKVVNEIAKGTRQINRGAKRANLALCNTPHLGTQASILVECSFMTNKREVKSMMGKTSYWRETGTEIAKAVCAYSGVNYLEK